MQKHPGRLQVFQYTALEVKVLLIVAKVGFLFFFTFRLIKCIVGVLLLSSFGMLAGKQNRGNPYLPRETPSWQKEITGFFKSAAVESMKKSQTPSNEKGGREMPMVL